MNGIFSRAEAVLGKEASERLARSRVLVVGVGGVGGWCAEALVRTGLGSVTLMDDDIVEPSNINRQCQATTRVVGEAKTEALRARLLDINPDCRVEARRERFPEGGDGRIRGFDLVVDAIDSVRCKAALLIEAAEACVPVLSSMGAALRTDPSKVRISDFSRVEGDGLARALRGRFRQLGRFPGRFQCVWSTEIPVKNLVRGSLVTVTSVFGMHLAAKAVEILTADGR